jgi:hypothetical protein
MSMAVAGTAARVKFVAHKSAFFILANTSDSPFVSVGQVFEVTCSLPIPLFFFRKETDCAWNYSNALGIFFPQNNTITER